MTEENIGKKEIEYYGKKVVVIGGAAGIGSSMTKEFSQRGASVTIFDIKDPQEVPKNTQYYNVDVRDMDNFPSGLSCDILVIAAGVTSKTNNPSEEEKELMRLVNIQGVRNALKYFQEILPSDGTVVYIGTDNPPKDFYKKTKLAGKKLLEIFKSKNPDLNIKILEVGPVATELFLKGKPEHVIDEIDAGPGIFEPGEFADLILDNIYDIEFPEGPLYKNKQAK